METNHQNDSPTSLYELEQTIKWLKNDRAFGNITNKMATYRGKKPTKYYLRSNEPILG